MTRALSPTALEKIRGFFSTNEEKIFGPKELNRILNAQRDAWRTWSFPYNALVDAIIRETPMKRVKLDAGSYGSITRFSWGEVSPYLLGLSIRPGSYLSHSTALFLHGLSDQVPAMTYVNKEQFAKPIDSSTAGLSQQTIDRAFSRPQRRSKYLFRLGKRQFLLISGKASGNLGVAPFTLPTAEIVQVTGIERTLIDSVVRPAYSGGVFTVLDAFRAAKERVSLPQLIGILRQLDYVYPYHQALGVYLEAAGFPKPVLDEIRDFGLKFDFYLAHGMAAKRFVASWRTFIPEDFPIESRA